MADGRFFNNAGPFSLAELVAISGASRVDTAAQSKLYADVQPLDSATPSDVSFLDNKKYKQSFLETAAGLCIVRPDMADSAPPGTQVLVTADPYAAYARVAGAFYPVPVPKGAISEFAHIDSDAQIGENCLIAPGVHIAAGVTIGTNCVIGAHTSIAAGCQIGNDARIGASVSLQYCLVGHSVIIHPGVCIGQDGFGFAPGAQGHLKVPQLGRVIIGDDVEIGANTTIDRGTGPDTVIGTGTKIDNLVQIGHNAEIGRHCFIVAHVGISGSTKIGDFTMIGGQVGIAGHLKIGAGVKIAAQSGVMRDVADGETIGGSPAQPMKTWFREIAMVQKLAKTKVGKHGQ
ncbi:MAG: UDP-3-O-(3-hydroxymyristoyl)glucosamine N-acyltransferase [Rhodospirillales bacterium]|nr:UDP-3-O-(3-hydroxymyristoyl)glucosamine N-acyltransferase [Rhodospirillales bacterium]